MLLLELGISIVYNLFDTVHNQSKIIMATFAGSITLHLYHYNDTTYMQGWGNGG